MFLSCGGVQRTWFLAYRPSAFAYDQVYTGEYITLHGMKVSSVWMNIYLSDFLRRIGLKFHKGLINEDIDFNMMLYPWLIASCSPIF